MDLASRRRRLRSVVPPPSPPSSTRRYRATAAGTLLLLLLLLLLSTGATATPAFVGGGATATDPRNAHLRPAPPFRRADGIRTAGALPPLHRRRTAASPLAAVRVTVRTPDQEEAVALGIREWPQRTRRGSWTESTPPSDGDDSPPLVRYVLDGTGVVEITPADSETGGKEGRKEVVRVGPGTMIEVAGGPAGLTWETTPEGSEMIVLTPGFEQLGQLAGVAGGLVLLCVVLFVVLSGGG